jgi:hypothetical protein
VAPQSIGRRLERSFPRRNRIRCLLRGAAWASEAVDDGADRARVFRSPSPNGLARPAKSAAYLLTTPASMLLAAKIVNTEDKVRTLLPPPGNEESVEKP